jgi:hypothetical protein
MQTWTQQIISYLWAEEMKKKVASLLNNGSPYLRRCLYHLQGAVKHMFYLSVYLDGFTFWYVRSNYMYTTAENFGIFCSK